MKQLVWRPMACEDRSRIMDFIAQDNALAAADLDQEIEDKTLALTRHPRIYRPGRVKGTREMVVHPNYIVVYRELGDTITIIRVLHAAQAYP